MNAPVFEIAILGRVVWNLHSLNNEGTIGNVCEPRTIVLADGTKSDGVSGEMLKHIHTQSLWMVAEDKRIFCQTCRVLGPKKADANSNLDGVAKKAGKGKEAQAVLDAALKQCALCDLHGFLRTKEAVPRSSTVEFGWAVAIRDGFHRDMHLHARHVVEGRTEKEEKPLRKSAEATDAETEEEGQRASGQMVYHRPTRSGTYALVTVFQPWRIGLNEVNYQYVDGVERESRYALALEAYKAAFARTDGAMTSTRLPHVEGFEGVVAVSTRNFPAPVCSPLQATYRETIKRLSAVTKGLELQEFGSLDTLFEILEALKLRLPYTLNIGTNP